MAYRFMQASSVHSSESFPYGLRSILDLQNPQYVILKAAAFFLVSYKLAVHFLGSTTSLENLLQLIQETWPPFCALQRHLCESFRSINSGRGSSVVSRAPYLDKVLLEYSLTLAVWQK